jgi:S1-C subfamily serine protease
MTTSEQQTRSTPSERRRRDRQLGALLGGLVSAVVAIVVVVGFAGRAGKTDAHIALDSTVTIRGFGCGLVPRGGAGVVVGERLVLTDAHVVAGASRLELAIGGRPTTGAVVHLDPDLDLALVQVNPHFASTSDLIVPLGPAAKGDQGTVAIRRHDRFETVPMPVLRAVRMTTEDIYVQGHVTRSAYELLATTQPGDSGSAVIVDGRAVAILWSRSRLNDHRAWATDARPIAPQIASLSARRIPSDTRCR